MKFKNVASETDNRILTSYLAKFGYVKQAQNLKCYQRADNSHELSIFKQRQKFGKCLLQIFADALRVYVCCVS